MAGHGDEKDEIEKRYSDYYQLRNYYKKNRILIDIDLSDLIDSLITKLHSALYSFSRIVETNNTLENELNSNKIDYNITRKREYWDKAADVMRKEAPPLLEKLEKEFRLTIGVINNVP